MQKNSEVLFQKGIENFRNKNFFEAEKCFEELKNIHPTNKDILKNLSICYFQNKKYENSEKIIETMFALGHKENKFIELLLLILKQQDKAEKILDIIPKEKNNINPKYELLEKFERPAIAMSNQELEHFRKNTYEKINLAITENNLSLRVDDHYLDPPLFYYSYENKDNLNLSKKMNELFRKSYPELQQKFQLKNIENKKIKIGFISEFFNKHTISKLFKGLIINLDKSLFDVNIFYLDNGKGLDQEFLNNEKESNLKSFKLPKPFNDKTNIILDQNLDIIFYPDIGFSTQLYYLTFLRLAKIQITSWGHPETTGNTNIDYFLSSKLLEENFEIAQTHYSEKLLMCDYLPMYYSKPKINRIDDTELQSNNNYSCPQSLFKLHPDFDDIILKILQNDKKAKIYLIKSKEAIFSKKIYDRLNKKMPNFIDKIIFINNLSEEEYINHCGKASVLLDPLYFGAGNSFHESMFYGTPTITLPTNFLRSKIVEGAYKQLEIKDAPVVKNVDDYVSSAVEIANLNPKKTLEIKKYYAECADKNLFQNKNALQSFQKILLEVVKK